MRLLPLAGLAAAVAVIALAYVGSYWAFGTRVGPDAFTMTYPGGTVGDGLRTIHRPLRWIDRLFHLEVFDTAGSPRVDHFPGP